MKLQPFFTYYGGKWRIAERYLHPEYKVIVEPFAGSAGYACRFAHHDVILIDKDPKIAGIWQYLVSVSPQEILSLPDVPLEGTVEDVVWPCDAAKWLAGMWLNKGAAAPCLRPSAWMRQKTHENSFWGSAIRTRIATQVPHIRHWQVIHGTYADAPDVPATWFVDPPYQLAGRHYKCGADQIDFTHLAAWCREREGQIMVCENEGATWLPFRPFDEVKATFKKSSQYSSEVWWWRTDLFEMPQGG